MKIGRLRQVTGTWKRLFFMHNTYKMRKSLMNYLDEEGIKNHVENGVVVFEFNEYPFCASVDIEKDFAECSITFQLENEDYSNLSLEDKTYIADKTNTENINHATTLTFGDQIVVKTSFYFTNKSMMLNLFSCHFEELNLSIRTMISLTNDKIQANKEKQERRRIGFYISKNEELDKDDTEMKIVAKK